jgi:hypothetical protein
MHRDSSIKMPFHICELMQISAIYTVVFIPSKRMHSSLTMPLMEGCQCEMSLSSRGCLAMVLNEEYSMLQLHNERVSLLRSEC